MYIFCTRANNTEMGTWRYFRQCSSGYFG